MHYKHISQSMSASAQIDERCAHTHTNPHADTKTVNLIKKIALLQSTIMIATEWFRH